MKNLRAAKITLSIGLLMVCYAYFDKEKIIGGEEAGFGLFIIGLLLVLIGAFGLGSEKT